MSFVPPNDASLKRAIPAIQDLSILDQGGFKVVYSALINGRKEALKLILIPPVDGSIDADEFRKESIGRIMREVRTLSTCIGPELVKLGSIPSEQVSIGGNDYVIYSEEFLEGENLWRIINSVTPKPGLAELKLLFATLLKAIKELWSKNLIHRDIKPCNVIKTTDPTRQFVLLDLGIAFSTVETAITADPARVVATYRYIAPEMMSPAFRDTIDFRSDLYTAALTVFEYAAKKHPLARAGDDRMQTITRALNQPPIPLRQERPDLPEDFCNVVDQMLKKKPGLRPSNLVVLIRQMEQA